MSFQNNGIEIPEMEEECFESRSAECEYFAKKGEAMPRILFAGTPDIAVPLLKNLAREFEVVGVLTAMDKAKGRSKQLLPSPVKVAALELGIPVLQFDTLKAASREAVSALGADTLVTFAFGKIFGPKFLSLFPGGTFNVHPSALPMFRGPSPIQETIRQGVRIATLSIQKIGLEMDAGDIYSSLSFDLKGNETTDTLTETVSRRASVFTLEVLHQAFTGVITPFKQVGEPSYCKMIEKSDSVLDFTEGVSALHCKIRSLYSSPKATAKFVPKGETEGRDIFITGVWGDFRYLDNPDKYEACSGNSGSDCKQISCPNKVEEIHKSNEIAGKNEVCEGNKVTKADNCGNGDKRSIVCEADKVSEAEGQNSETATLRLGSVVEINKEKGIGVFCKDGILWINSLQLPSKKQMDFKSFVNGNTWIKEGYFE